MIKNYPNILFEVTNFHNVDFRFRKLNLETNLENIIYVITKHQWLIKLNKDRQPVYASKNVIGRINKVTRANI